MLAPISAATGLLAGLFLGAMPQVDPEAAAPLHFEVRIFDGSEEVTDGVRLRIHPTGRRDTVVADVAAGRVRVPVAPDFYDVAVIREQQGRVVGLKWAERLLVQAHPDEAGEHLRVINLRAGYGAVQIRPDPRAPAPASLAAAAYAAGMRDRPVGSPVRGDGYLLFVLPAGHYDLSIEVDGRTQWRSAVEVPSDVTRLVLADPPDR